MRPVHVRRRRVREGLALDAAEPSLVFFTTLMGSREVEGSAGKIIVDAIKAKGGVQHVVYSSVANADVAPDAVGHFKSKLDVENHLKAESGPPRHLTPARWRGDAGSSPLASAAGQWP